MRTVRDESGKRYLLEKESGESSRVRDPETGERRHLRNDRLEPVGGESPLATAARGVSEPVRRLVTAVHDDRGLGLLIELDERGPLPAVTLLDAYDMCESDLHGLFTEFRAAGLVEEARIDGKRGYALTDQGRAAFDCLR